MAKILVEVAYASVNAQAIYPIHIEEGATILQAINQSPVLTDFPEINLDHQKVGIYSKICTLDTKVNTCDRIEIYRPLSIDPKEARRARAKK